MNKQVGFIGIGNMGGLLLHAFIEHQALEASQIWITNRSKEKVEQMKKIHPAIHTCQSTEEIVQNCTFIFLCAKPAEIIKIAKQISPFVTQKQIVVSITSPITTLDLETILRSQVARIVPSIVNRVGKGISLFTFGKSCTEETKLELKQLFQNISVPLEISNDKIRVASDLSSCGPAFIGHLMELIVEGATEVTTITKEEATKIIEQTLIGLGALLEQNIFTLPELIEKVCVKGGITGEGIRILNHEVGTLFPALFMATQEKFKEDILHIQLRT